MGQAVDEADAESVPVLVLQSFSVKAVTSSSPFPSSYPARAAAAK